MRAAALLALVSTADALLLSGDGPSSRRAKLRELARLAAGGLAASCGAVLLAGHPRWTSPTWGGGGEELSLYSDDVATARQLASLQSANDLAPARRRLESDWATLRKRPVSRSEAEAAFATVLRARAAVARAEAAVRAGSPRWVDEAEAAISSKLVRELEAAATVLASASALIGPEGRADIGWQWGACGNRHCGAQADAAQALCKLRANLGMIVPLEALFYLDVAKVRVRVRVRAWARVRVRVR